MEKQVGKTESLKAEISAKISVIKTDFYYLNNMYSDSPHRTAVLKKFTETLDKSETLSYAVELSRFETFCNAPVSDSGAGNVTSPPDIENAVTEPSECKNKHKKKHKKKSKKKSRKIIIRL